MSNLFTKLAQEASSNSKVRQGRTVLSTMEVVAKYPNGITITEFDMITARDVNTGELKTFPTLAFAEDISRYINGGTALKQVVDKWLEHFDGDIEECNNALRAAGGAKLRILPPTRTSSGTNFYPVEPVMD